MWANMFLLKSLSPGDSRQLVVLPNRGDINQDLHRRGRMRETPRDGNLGSLECSSRRFGSIHFIGPFVTLPLALVLCLVNWIELLIIYNWSLFYVVNIYNIKFTILTIFNGFSQCH